MSFIDHAVGVITGTVTDQVNHVAAVVKDPMEEVNQRAAELRSWRDNVKNLNPAGASEELWAEAGRYAYPTAAATMARRSPTGEAIAYRQKGILHIFFGDITYSTTLHWGTAPLDKWAAEQFSIKVSDVDTAAQTYGYDIYIEAHKGDETMLDELTLLAHELVHVSQFANYGNSYSNFGYQYFKAYKKAGRKYEKNALEKAAYQFVEEIEPRLKVLVKKPSSANREKYFKRVKAHAKSQYVAMGQTEVWGAILNAAEADAGATSGATYLKRVRDHVQWNLFTTSQTKIWEKIHRAALKDIDEL